MPYLVMALSMAVAIALLPFLKGEPTPFRTQNDALTETHAHQLEEFARSAWHLARTGVNGPLDRSQMLLPSGYADDPAYPYQARVLLGNVFVWETGRNPEDQRIDLIFPEGDHTVDVGMSNAQSIRFRDGGSAPRPSWIPYPNLVVRLKL